MKHLQKSDTRNCRAPPCAGSRGRSHISMLVTQRLRLCLTVQVQTRKQLSHSSAPGQREQWHGAQGFPKHTSGNKLLWKGSGGLGSSGLLLITSSPQFQLCLLTPARLHSFYPLRSGSVSCFPKAAGSLPDAVVSPPQQRWVFAPKPGAARRHSRVAVGSAGSCPLAASSSLSQPCWVCPARSVKRSAWPLSASFNLPCCIYILKPVHIQPSVRFT